MPRSSTALTAELLSTLRPGVALAVAVGAPAGIPDAQELGYTMPADRVAQVNIIGATTQRTSAWDCGESIGYDAIAGYSIAALRDPNVGALVLVGDTPGGDEPGLDECAASIRAVADEVGKPVIGYGPSYLASAGIWLFVGVCDLIFHHRSARAGSVGSVVLFPDESEALAQKGRKIYASRVPAGKMKPAPFEPLDAIGKARIDEHAQACAADFVALVAERRHLAPDVIRGWDGRMFRGQDAVDAGLIDGLGTYESTIRVAATHASRGAAA